MYKRYWWALGALLLVWPVIGQNLIPNGGMEGDVPNYFTTGGTSTTAQLDWATDAYRTGGHSLKISKSSGDGTAYWSADDLYRYWSVFVQPNVGMQVGAWVKLEGVNTNPQTDDEKIRLVFSFQDAQGNNLLDSDLYLDVPQDAASTGGWVEVSSQEPLSFPVTVDRVAFRFEFGSGATGTAWVDDIFIRNTTEGEWAGDFFNPNVDVPEGWFYWWPDYSAGKSDWDTVTPSFMGVTTEEAHTGNSSLKIVELDGENDETVVNCDPVTFVNDGSPILFSVWLKAELPPGMADSARVNGSYGVGFTVTWHDGSCGADGWGEVGGSDFRFILPSDTTDWLQYTAVLTPPEGATQFSLRARYWNFFEGTTYWDDFEAYQLTQEVVAIDPNGSQVLYPNRTELLRAYPNPFNPVINLNYKVPTSGRLRLDIYDLRGQLIQTLFDGTAPAGRYQARWDGRDLNGHPVPSGIYLAILRGAGFQGVQRITLLK